MAVFCNRLIDGQPLDICGDCEQTRDHVCAEATATADRIAADMPLGSGVGLHAGAFNTGTGEATSGNRLETLLEETAGARPGQVQKDARAGELRHSVLSTADPEQRVGHPRISCARDRRTFSAMSRPRERCRARPAIIGRSCQTAPLSVMVQIYHAMGDYNPLHG